MRENIEAPYASRASRKIFPTNAIVEETRNRIGGIFVSCVLPPLENRGILFVFAVIECFVFNHQEKGNCDEERTVDWVVPSRDAACGNRADGDCEPAGVAVSGAEANHAV